MNIMFSPLRLIGERLRCGDHGELKQATLRLLVSGMVSVCLLFVSQSLHVVSVVGAYLALAILLFGGLSIWPGKNVPRRIIGIVADVAVATWGIAIWANQA
jgi:hypothetical protein